MFVKFNKGPAPLLDVVESAALRTVAIALKMNLFEILNNSPSSSTIEIANQIKADERAIIAVLEMLEALGYVKRNEKDGRYSITVMASKWLLKDSSTSLANYIIMWNELTFQFWDQQLEQSIVNGKPSISIYDWFNEEPSRWRLFQTALRELARFSAVEVVERMKISHSQSASSSSNTIKLLDVGGGHGLYSIEYCKRYPDLSATIFDLPLALESARENIRTFSMEDRIFIQPGNYLLQDNSFGKPNDYDQALLFNIVHAHSSDENIALLYKVAQALKPEGRVVILESLAGNKPSGPTTKSFSKFFNLTFLVTLGAKSYSYKEIAGWLRETGFKKVDRIDLKRTPGVSLVIGQK